jgi:isochorismate synthase EntC
LRPILKIKRKIMKKIILATALSISALLAFDVAGALKNVGTAALNGDTDAKSLTKTAGESLGLTPEALGEKLATTVKSNNTAISTMDKAKSLCDQASSVQSFVNLDAELVTKAIAICSEHVMETK